MRPTQVWNSTKTRHLVIAAIFVTLSGGSAPATSVIVDFQQSQIVVLADSRAQDSHSAIPRDNQCKIAILGEQFIFAEMGMEGYTKGNAFDHIPEWHGMPVARESFRKTQQSTDRLFESAKMWGQTITNDIYQLYISNPTIVRKSAFVPTGTLVAGVFAGENEGSLTYLLVVVYYDGAVHQGNPIKFVIKQWDAQPTPYALHSITDELIAGQTDRAKKVASIWRRNSANIPANLIRQKWLDFLLRETSRFDPWVGGPTSAAHVTGKKTEWLEKGVCGN